MFRSIFDHPQGDIFFLFTSVTKDKIIGFVVACLLYLLCFVLMLMRALPSLVVAVNLSAILLVHKRIMSRKSWVFCRMCVDSCFTFVSVLFLSVYY